MTLLASSQEWQNVAQDHHPQQKIELFETELNRWLEGKVPDPLFTEFRLRHGVYGQRQDGVQMIRIKIPLGMVSARQIEVIAELSEELADGVSHVTTRQGIQYHNVDIRNTPELMRRLDDVGMTTIEACGNVVRNVCACPKTGACSAEAFDTTPDALAMADFLLDHPDAQDFGRKFKISYSGCADQMCGLARMHDLGVIAKILEVDGVSVEGFQVYIGGGLGAVPRQARLLYDFLPRKELYEIAQVLGRLFTRYGERKNRNKARFKFVVDRLGIDELRAELEAERAKLPKENPVRDRVLEKYAAYSESPLKAASSLNVSQQSPEFQKWHHFNVEAQKTEGYSIVHVFFPLGDISANTLRALGRLSQKYIKESIRFTVEQNLILRWVSNQDLPELYGALKALDLAGFANTLADITACPGSDSCKLGIAASRGLASTLYHNFQDANLQAEVKELGQRNDLKIKISGCPNSCSQHHIAEIGFFGSAQSKQGKAAPVFQMVLGGTTHGNGESYGLALGKISPHNIPESLQRLDQLFRNAKEGNELFPAFVKRVGKKYIKQELADLMKLPTYEEHPEFFRDLRSPRNFVVETSKGECAGELLPRTEFLLEECDRQNAQASSLLEESRNQEAFELALSSMEKAAKALLLTQGYEEFGDYDTQTEFRSKLVDSGMFFSKFADYYFSATPEQFATLDEQGVRYNMEHATLFVEEAHVIYTKIAQSQSSNVA